MSDIAMPTYRHSREHTSTTPNHDATVENLQLLNIKPVALTYQELQEVALWYVLNLLSTHSL